MTEPNSPAAPSSSAWDQLDEVVTNFEQAWLHGSAPSIDDYLKEAVVDRPTLRAELVRVEMECRLSAGEMIRAENYFERYPELAADRKRAVNLIVWEYKIRRLLEPGLTADEFFWRFPQYREDLGEDLGGPHRPKTWAAPSRLNCPHCRGLVTVEGDTQQREISCSACGHSFRVDATAAAPEPPPELSRLGEFQLLGVVGQGGFGTVYRARDTRLDRVVAVKVPRDRRGSSWEAERILREARSAAQLDHPGIVAVYDVGRAGMLPYIVSAFIQGRTLAEEMADRRLAFREAADLVAQVARALAYAHGRGVVHRDLKPSNIMLGRVEGSARPNGLGPSENGSSEGVRAFVMDFGLARRDEGEVRVTLDGDILGTPSYMSPEQARGEGHHADGRSDVYSLGVILYEMLTGEVPFRGTPRMVFKKILEEEPQAPRRLNDKIPRDLETIALKCLAKEPGRRYPSADDLAADLERYLADRPILARPVGRVERTWRWARRNPRVAIPSGVALVLVLSWLVGGPVALYYIDQQRQVAVAATAVAEQRERLNLDALSKVVAGVRQDLQDQPARNQLKQRLLSIALELSEKMAAIAPNAAAEGTTAEAHLLLGDIYLTLGQTAEARQKFTQAYTSFQALATAHPGDWRAQRNLYVVYGRLGDVSRRTGNTPEALRYHEKALELARTRADAAVETTAAKYDLIQSRNALAEIYQDCGDRVQAREHFHKALEVATTLEAEDAHSIPTKTHLADTCGKLGWLDLNSGRAGEAQKHFERGVSLYEGITAAEPNNFLAGRCLAQAYAFLGDAHRHQGRRTEALAWYQKSLGLYQDLARRASHRGVQSELAIGYDRLSSVNNLLGDLPAALDYARKALAEREDLATADPENAKLQYVWAVACYNVAQLAMQNHEFDQAAQSYQQVLTILGRPLGAGKLVNLADVRRLVQTARRLLVIARLAPRAVENLTWALWAPAEGLPAFGAGLVGVLGAPEAQGPWLAAAALFPGRAGPDDRVRELLCIRAAVLARRGRFTEAAATAETLRAIAPYDKMARYNVACSYAACVAAVAQGKPSGRLTPEEDARRQHYADLAVAALKEAVDLGFTDVQHIVTDQDLVPIFPEKGFTELVEGLKAKRVKETQE